MDYCWQRFVRLQGSRPGNRVCQRLDDHGNELCDVERGQCDTWNLGCLVQYFPDLRDPNAQPYSNSINSIFGTIDALYDYQNQCSSVNPHIHVSTCTSLRLKMNKCAARIEGLRLK